MRRPAFRYSLKSERSYFGTSRLETLTKQLGRKVLLSRAFADFVERDFDLERVGEYPVRGFNDPIELFAYRG
jgi:adenylate cyclase